MMDLEELTVLERLFDEDRTHSKWLNAYLWNLVDDRPLESGYGSDRLLKRVPEDRIAFDAAPDYVRNLELAYTLVERLRSNWRWSTRKDNGGYYTASIVLCSGVDFLSLEPIVEHDTETVTARSSQPSWALCHALVKALVIDLNKRAICP